jgi:hypothetical protein
VDPRGSKRPVKFRTVASATTLNFGEGSDTLPFTVIEIAVHRLLLGF